MVNASIIWEVQNAKSSIMFMDANMEGPVEITTYHSSHGEN